MSLEVFAAGFTPEYTAEVGGYAVRLEKMGGGTVGRSYVGSWGFLVTDHLGALVDYGWSFHTGSPRTHAQAARELVELLRWQALDE